VDLDNRTPFAAAPCAVADLDGADFLVVIFKATYALDGAGGMALADEQRPVELADRYVGEPGVSSVAYASDLALHKTATDVVLAGHAYPARTGDREGEVGVQIGAVRATARVFGDREWQSALGATRMSRPAAFERIPLGYERAAGGADTSPADERDHGLDPRNPVGVGFRARRSRRPVDAARLPNFEDPAALVRTPQDAPPPAAVGFVAPGWAPRVAWAGTYDAAWSTARKPLLPSDFDARFFNAAPPALTAPGFLRGDEHGAALGVSPYGLLRFTLPRALPAVEVTGKTTGRTAVPVNLDRVLVDGDGGAQGEVVLVWSGGLRVTRGFHDLDAVTLTLG
jgi:hypothetical protein